MPVHFLTCELAKWDASKSDALVLTFFGDERPLRGAAGLADWRLCGRLSRLIRHKQMTGATGESLMMPPGHRLPFRLLILLGLGSSAGFDAATYRRQVVRIRDVIARAGISSYAIQPPGRATELIAPRHALEMWIQEAGLYSEDDVSIIDTQLAQKEMSDILQAHERVVRRQASSARDGI